MSKTYYLIDNRTKSSIDVIELGEEDLSIINNIHNFFNVQEIIKEIKKGVLLLIEDNEDNNFLNMYKEFSENNDHDNCKLMLKAVLRNAEDYDYINKTLEILKLV